MKWSGAPLRRAVFVLHYAPNEDWRPVRNNGRTKTVWELLPFYTRTCDARSIFVRGDKPAELSQIPRISVRQWQHYQSATNRNNPVLQGLQWLRLFENESVRTYAQAAEIAGVCRGRVWQLVSLVTRLPKEITDFLAANKDPFIRAHFSERKLRPLTLLESDERKIKQFHEMLTKMSKMG
ncbi:MAG: hypothetical protein WCL44_12360 [bacterium]